MIQIKYYLFYSFVSISFWGCAQSRYPIKNVYAVYKVHLPGNIAVDENGNEIASRDTLNFIYIESPTKNIVWDAAWKNGTTYFIRPTLIDSNPFDAGINAITNENMVIHISDNNRLWQLQLIPSEKKLPVPSKIVHDEILLQGKYRGKTILQKINNQVKLHSIPSQ